MRVRQRSSDVQDVVVTKHIGDESFDEADWTLDELTYVRDNVWLSVHLKFHTVKSACGAGVFWVSTLFCYAIPLIYCGVQAIVH